MSVATSPHYDVAVVGGGPVGSFCALAHARAGARVALLEANPKASRRLAGEWLHPPAVRMLRAVGLNLDDEPRSAPGKGFVVSPEDRSEPIVLPYPGGRVGVACEHAALVSALHKALENEPGVDYHANTRVRSVEDRRVGFAHNGRERSLRAARIVGADGRASIVRRSLGLPTARLTCSRMIGIAIEDVTLPFEGYGHVLLGGPGPVLMFRLDEGRVRIVVDVPLDHWTQDRMALLGDSYADVLPGAVRDRFFDALREGRFKAANNELRPRSSYGTSRRVLVGDAAGHYHPLTAVGLTLGFGDALRLAEARESFDDFTVGRLDATRGPELLAMSLYEVFADHRIEAASLRQAVYRKWRASAGVRDRTMGLLACEDTSAPRRGLAFYGMVAGTVAAALPRSGDPRAWRRARDTVHALVVRIGHCRRGFRDLRKAEGTSADREGKAADRLAKGLLVSMGSRHGDVRPGRASTVASVDAATALRRATRRLLDLQDEDGRWEGEMTWCPMLAAQYVLLHHLIGRPLAPGRRRRILRHFAQTRLRDGAWGLHEHSHPYLFVTTLVYVAARLLGVERDDALIERAGRFMRNEGVLAIPTWGKFWLALLGLYDWRGVHAMLPELWRLPRWLPFHPARWYCHTRHIYMGMAAVYARRYTTPVTPLIAALREELFPDGFANVDFRAGRSRLREADLYARPTPACRAAQGVAWVFERFRGERLRERCRVALTRRIRWELRSSSHTSISPVSGFLNILALWLDDPDDADCRAALNRVDDWIWEDEADGARVTGARSASWDTGFALQALAAGPRLAGLSDALRKGADFLRGQQIRTSFDGFREAERADPRGGWCFAGAWHGWPVTDCTAEAVLGTIAADREGVDERALADAVRFMLRGQNRDGGFGSYEARRSMFGLEWLNPAEMFGDSMTEHSYVECTASCLSAIAACRRDFPRVTDTAAARAMERADAWLRRTQASDGSWRGVWGVQFIYGTFFGIRGLLAAGAPPGDPAVRLASRWLLDRQRSDGGWGEHHSGCVAGRYVPHEESQVIQTAWALTALLEAGDSNWTAISRGAEFLCNAQDTDGTWRRQDMAGVFFRTALLDYALYRQYFPLHALALYEARRRARTACAAPVDHPARAAG